MKPVASAFALALLVAAPSARAGGPIGPNGTPIATSAYAVDLSEGPVLAGTRVTGLAGAYVAIAEGTEGNVQNPAAPAVRTAYSTDHLDYDWGVGVTFPSTIANTDFFNTGEPGTNVGQTATGGFLFLDLSANVQLGRWGIGATINAQTYDIDRTNATAGQVTHLRAQFGTGHILVARWVDKGQLVIGGGLRLSLLTVTNRNPTAGQPGTLFDTSGAALEAGMLWRPNDQHFRFGASVRSAVAGADAKTAIPTDSNGDRVVGDPASADALYLPNDVALPWDVSVGLAIQLGPRPFNPRWYDPEEVLARTRRYLEWRARERARRKAYLVRHGRDPAAVDAENATEAALDRLAMQRAKDALHQRLEARYRAMAGFHVLISTSLTISGPVKDAVGIESFLSQRVNREGERTTLTPRLGVETGIIPHWVNVRAGSYYEPTRFSSAPARARVHVTGGADIKLFPWTVFGLFEDGTEWRVAGAIDRAARYSGWSVAVGVWH